MLARLRKHFKKAQSTVEYGILIGVIVAAAVAMQTYIKRSIQAKQHDSADLMTSVGGTVNFGTGQSGNLGRATQYEPYYLARHQEQVTTQDDLTKDVAQGGGATTTKDKQSTVRSAVIYRYGNAN